MSFKYLLVWPHSRLFRATDFIFDAAFFKFHSQSCLLVCQSQTNVWLKFSWPPYSNHWTIHKGSDEWCHFLALVLWSLHLFMKMFNGWNMLWVLFNNMILSIHVCAFVLWTALRKIDTHGWHQKKCQREAKLWSVEMCSFLFLYNFPFCEGISVWSLSIFFIRGFSTLSNNIQKTPTWLWN